MLTDDAVAVLLRAVNEWRGRPSVDAWCHAELSEVIVARFPELTRYLPYQDNLTPALERTGLYDTALQELVLRGIERHVDGFDPELIFALTGLVGSRLPPSEAAGLVEWYSRRLAERIPTEDRDQSVPLSSLPQQTDKAVARFLFAYMGDCDLRLRWRAAHAVRRLARTGDQATLKALVKLASGLGHHLSTDELRQPGDDPSDVEICPLSDCLEHLFFECNAGVSAAFKGQGRGEVLKLFGGQPCCIGQTDFRRVRRLRLTRWNRKGLRGCAFHRGDHLLSKGLVADQNSGNRRACRTRHSQRFPCLCEPAHDGSCSCLA